MGKREQKQQLNQHFRVASVLGVIWLAAGIGLTFYLKGSSPERFFVLKWVIALWLISMTDLLALGKTLIAAIALMSESGERRSAQFVQAGVWGLIKLGCFGAFTGVFIKADGVPTLGLVMGLGTLIIVPLLSGLVWSQKVLRHA